MQFENFKAMHVIIFEYDVLSGIDIIRTSPKLSIP